LTENIISILSDAKAEDIKIIDLNIEGISLIIAQREEFQSFLANNNSDLDKLISKLENINM